MKKKHPPKGFARYLILEMMGEKPRYGYEILEKLSDISGGHWDPSYGTVYGALESLKEKGYARRIEEEHEDRKYFELTDEGRKFLKKQRKQKKKLRKKFRKMVLGMFNVYEHLHGKGKTKEVLDDIKEELELN